MDVVVWLRSLGLGQYEAAFRDNDIDETVLPNLTAEDLKELGVASLGHRRKLLDAIAALRADANASTTTTPGPAAIDASPRDAAERRHVTVMFSDLVGSTALSARMDPEDLREVISAYQKCVAESVQRFGGFVAKYMGDGVLIYFGYPQAQPMQRFFRDFATFRNNPVHQPDFAATLIAQAYFGLPMQDFDF
jgi:class 3 adenylate cyclase